MGERRRGEGGMDQGKEERSEKGTEGLREERGREERREL